MEGTKIEGADLEVSHEVDPDARSVRISRRIGLLEPAFVTNCDQVVRIN